MPKPTNRISANTARQHSVRRIRYWAPGMATQPGPARSSRQFRLPMLDAFRRRQFARSGPDRIPADSPKRTLHCSTRAFATESSLCRSNRIQSPAIVKPSTSRLGTQYGLNGSGSLAGINDFRKCFRFPAIVSSLTGYLISPFSTQNPDAPRE